jgi:cytochrome c2
MTNRVRVVPQLVCGALALAALLTGCGESEKLEGRHSTGGDPRRGAALIESYGCGACHTVPGVRAANATVGPPLSGFSGRTYVAGTLPNSAQHLVLWIRHPQQIQPRTAMPDLGVNETDARDIAAYLYEH